MLIVASLIAVSLIVLSIFIQKSDEWAISPVLLGVFAGFLLVSTLIGFCICGSALKAGNYIDDKIEMYQSENAKIETQVAECIETYLSHEKGIIDAASDKIEPGTALTLIAAYPELHSSELITKQIEVYNNNNIQIKELRAAKIDLAVYRWWVYFG